ncbi:unnamed protein product [Moneuplotes crassus]|uniref:Uncharacterized protein n=1 Tax=Euplotes crassus TaxID=5936 RepID=A0AAD1UA54_EUPCR|nr:unnamed protein product [Moneuplotes crassus]
MLELRGPVSKFKSKLYSNRSSCNQTNVFRTKMIALAYNQKKAKNGSLKRHRRKLSIAVDEPKPESNEFILPKEITHQDSLGLVMPDKGGKTTSARINLIVSRKEKRKSILSNKNSSRKIQRNQLKREISERNKTQMKNKLKSMHYRKGSMTLKHNKSESKDDSKNFGDHSKSVSLNPKTYTHEKSRLGNKLKVNLKAKLISSNYVCRVSSTQNRREGKRLFKNRSKANVKAPTENSSEADINTKDLYSQIPDSEIILEDKPDTKLNIMKKIFSKNYNGEKNPKMSIKKLIRNYKKQKSESVRDSGIEDKHNYSYNDILARNYKPRAAGLPLLKPRQRKENLNIMKKYFK